MADRHSRKTPVNETRPKIWATGSQHPPFELRALARASLFLSPARIGWVFAGTALLTRAGALGVRDGVGRIPAARLGRVAPYVPSDLRVAMWIKTCAAIQAHASATADSDGKRGNALVSEVETHLWVEDTVGMPPPPGQAAATAIQIIGYGIGWASAFVALSYGVIRSLWAYARGHDLRKIGRDA